MGISQYSGVMMDKFNSENQLRREIKALDDIKKRVIVQIEALQERYNEFTKPNNI
jgi:hypothetical protein